MKYIFKIAIIPFLLIALASCNDDEFLDQSPPDKLTSSSFWRNAEDAESGLTAAYSELESRSNFWDGWQEGRPVVEYFRSDYALPGPDATAGSASCHGWRLLIFVMRNNRRFPVTY